MGNSCGRNHKKTKKLALIEFDESELYIYLFNQVSEDEGELLRIEIHSISFYLRFMTVDTEIFTLY